MERIKHALAEARQRREQLAERAYSEIGAVALDQEPGPFQTDSVDTHWLHNSKFWLALGAAALMIAVATWATVYSRQPQKVTLSALETDMLRTDSMVSEKQSNIAVTEKLNESIGALAARMDLLDATIARLDDKTRELQQRIDANHASSGTTPVTLASAADNVSQPLPEALAPDTSTEEQRQAAEVAEPSSPKPSLEAPASDTGTEKPRRVTEVTEPPSPEPLPEADPKPTTEAAAAKAPKTEVAAAATPVPKAPAGPWFINLVSFADAPSANRFAARAKAKGVDVEQDEVTIKGKPYWRVRISGFDSAREASKHADSVKAKLDLGEIWIGKI